MEMKVNRRRWTRQNGRDIREDVAEHVLSDHDVELVRCLEERAHRRAVWPLVLRRQICVEVEAYLELEF